MYNDDVIDELHRVRDAYAALFGYDLDAMYRDIKEQEREERLKGRVFVTPPSKHPEKPYVPEERPKAA